MKVDKETSRIHTMVFTEKTPEEIYDFQEKLNKYIRITNETSSIFFEYAHGFGEKISDFQERIKFIDKTFGNTRTIVFSEKQMFNASAGKMIIMIWKNPDFNILDRPIRPIFSAREAFEIS